MPNKNSFIVCLCDAILNGISTAPTLEIITAAMLEPPNGGKREGDLEQYDCPAKSFKFSRKYIIYRAHTTA